MLFTPKCPQQPKPLKKLAHKPEIIADIALLMWGEIAYFEVNLNALCAEFSYY